MSTIKKKTFKKRIMEFVNADGSKISGDERYNKGVDVKTGPINMPGDVKGMSPTTDDHAANAIQPRNWWWSLTYGYSQSIGQSNAAAPANNLDTPVYSESEQKMKDIVDEMISTKSDSKDFTKKRGDNDINRNNIPDIEELSDTKMIIVSKLRDLTDTINASNLSGEEIGIVINDLASNVDTKKVPTDYKNLIRKKL